MVLLEGRQPRRSLGGNPLAGVAQPAITKVLHQLPKHDTPTRRGQMDKSNYTVYLHTAQKFFGLPAARGNTTGPGGAGGARSPGRGRAVC